MANFVSGYEGTVDDIEDALRSPFQGNIVPVVRSSDSVLVTANNAGTRQVNVSLGSTWAHGVRAVFDATTLTFDAVTTTGQSRWDAVIIRRDWGANTATLMKVNGVAAVNAPKVLPSGLNNSPGNLHDQVLALVQITFGSTVPTVAEDRRLLAHKKLWAASVAALPTASTAFYGMEANVGTGMTPYWCGRNSSGSAAWLPSPSGYQWASQVSVISSGAGFTGNQLANRAGYNPTTGDVQLDIQLRRNGAALTPAATTGNFSPDIVLGTILAPYRPDRTIPIFGQYRDPNGIWFPFNGSLSEGGTATIYGGTPGASMGSFTGTTNDNTVSVRSFVRFTREV